MKMIILYTNIYIKEIIKLFNYLRKTVFIFENIYMFSVFKSTMVVLSTGGVGFLSMTAAIEAAARATTQAITIPAIAPPLKPLELLL